MIVVYPYDRKSRLLLPETTFEWLFCIALFPITVVQVWLYTRDVT